MPVSMTAELPQYKDVDRRHATAWAEAAPNVGRRKGFKAKPKPKAKAPRAKAKVAKKVPEEAKEVEEAEEVLAALTAEKEQTAQE